MTCFDPKPKKRSSSIAFCLGCLHLIRINVIPSRDAAFQVLVGCSFYFWYFFSFGPEKIKGEMKEREAYLLILASFFGFAFGLAD